MRNLVAVASIALLTLAFAGCADDPERYPDGVPSSSSSRTSATTASSTSATGTTTSSTNGTGGNNAPTASITLAANQSASGPAPLNVTFVLNGTDPDGDPLTWTLSFGNGTNSTPVEGTELPALVNHTFEAGNHTVSFELSDGQTTTNATYVITSGSGDPNAGLPAPIAFSGEAANYGPAGCGAFPNPFLDTVYHEFDTALSGSWKYRTDPVEMTTEWWAGDAGPEIGGGEGVIPAGTDNVIACPAADPAPAAAASAYTLTLYHPDYVLPEEPAEGEG